MDEILDAAVLAVGLQVPRQRRIDAADSPDDKDAIELSDDDLIVDEKVDVGKGASAKSSIPPFTKTLWRRKIEISLLRKARVLTHPLLQRRPQGTEQEIADALMDIRQLTHSKAELPGDRRLVDETLAQVALPTPDGTTEKSVSRFGWLKVSGGVALIMLAGASYYFWILSQTSNSETNSSESAMLQEEYDKLRAQIESSDKANAETSAAKASFSSRDRAHADESTADKIEAKLRQNFGGSPATSISSSPAGKRTRAKVKQVMERITPSVRACAAKTHGMVIVSAEIAQDGQVAKAMAIGAYAGTPIGECAARVVKRTRFPMSDKSTSVKYPFSF